VSTFSYTVAVTPAADGEVEISVAAGVVFDATGTNENTASNLLTRVYDSVPPTATLTTAHDTTTNTQPFSMTLTFSEVRKPRARACSLTICGSA
jgi:hypothetical protein